MKYFVSSMNRKLYIQYGEKFLKGWSDLASEDTQLIICFEGEAGDEINSWNNKKNIKIVDIKSNIHDHFVKKFHRFNEAKGIQFVPLNDGTKNLRYVYNYRFDAIRFAFKVFSFAKCIELNLIDNDFAWIDSDVVCLKKFNSDEMSQFFPERNQLASYLGRNAFPQPNPYSECGFVAYNYQHPDVMKFMNECIQQYVSGDIFLLKEWHDCMVFDHVRSRYEGRGIEFRNLSEKFITSEHPFMLTNLANYFDHLKGPVRKQNGHS